MPNIEFSTEGVVVFKSAIKNQADLWIETPPVYASPAGVEIAYDEMGKVLLERVRGVVGVPKEFNSSAVDGGTAVIPRFMYAGVAAAAERGYSLEQLKNSMYNHNSFQTMTLFTREINAVAKRLEIPLGLRPVGRMSVDDSLHSFALDEKTGLTIPGYRNQQIDARLDAYSQGHLPLEGLNAENDPMCAGQRTGINQHMYRAMLAICINDPHLYPATLAR